MTDQEVVRRLIEEAEVEQANGQRGLTRFLSKWRKELKDGSTPSEKHDSEWSLLTSPQAAAEVRSTMPPIPQSFQPDPPGSQPFAGVSPTGVKEKATTPSPKPVSEVRSQEIKILPPGSTIWTERRELVSLVKRRLSLWSRLQKRCKARQQNWPA